MKKKFKKRKEKIPGCSGLRALPTLSFESKGKFMPGKPVNFLILHLF